MKDKSLFSRCLHSGDGGRNKATNKFKNTVKRAMEALPTMRHLTWYNMRYLSPYPHKFYQLGFTEIEIKSFKHIFLVGHNLTEHLTVFQLLC